MDRSPRDVGHPATGALRRAAGITVRLLLAVMVVAAVVAAARSGWGDRYLGALTERVRDLGLLGPLLYGLAYLPATLLLVPTGPLSMGAGYLFGWGTGFLLGTFGRGHSRLRWCCWWPERWATWSVRIGENA